MAKKESKEKRIEDIIKAAIDEFLDKGYDYTNLDSIAQKAGVSKGTLYYHFKNKEDILLKVNQKLSEPIYELIEEVSNISCVSDAIRHYIQKYLRYWNDHRRELIFFFLTMSKVLSCKDVWDLYGESIESNVDSLKALFMKGIESGEFVVHNPCTSALSLMSSLDGILGYMVIDRKLILEEIIESFEEKFVTSILSR